MAQISIIQHSDVKKAKRIDSEYYKTQFLKIEAKLKTLTTKPLNHRDISTVFDGNHLKITDSFSVESNSIPYYRGQDVKSFFLEDVEPLRIKRETYDKTWMKRSHFHTNDILLSIVGTVGNISLVTDRIKLSTGSCKLAIIRAQKISSGYLAAFLLSKYGKGQIDRNIRGAVQQGLILKDFKLIHVYIPDNEFQNRISNIVNKAIETKRKSEQLCKEAETILLEELDLLNYKTEQPLTFETTRKEVETAKRFDAEYFQPKYEKIIKHIENYSGGYDVVKNFVTWKKGIEVGSDAYTETGKEFVRVSDCSTFEIKESSRKISAAMYEGLQKKHQPKRGDIIFTKDGTIGITSVLKDDIDGVLSSAFLSLTLKAKYKSYNKECFALILNSIVTKMQVEQLSGGAIIAHLKPSDFEKFKLPIIRPSIQQQIAEKVNRSHQLRKESKELLEEAKRRVEEEIEKR